MSTDMAVGLVALGGFALWYVGHYVISRRPAPEPERLWCGCFAWSRSYMSHTQTVLRRPNSPEEFAPGAAYAIEYVCDSGKRKIVPLVDVESGPRA